MSVVSVVGAFRTGKSFLLSLFLRFLRAAENADKEAEEGGGTVPDGIDWASEGGALGGDSSFAWRGGKERTTTGIWMWSRPFLRPRAASAGGGVVAVLLVDTQGMFDMRSNQMLTVRLPPRP